MKTNNPVYLDKFTLLEILSPLKPVIKGSDIECECPVCGKREFGVHLGENHLFNCYRKKKCGIVGNIFTMLKLLNRTDILFNKEKDTKEFGENVLKLFGIEESEDKDFDLFLPEEELPIGFKKITFNEYLESRGFEYYERYSPGVTRIEPKYNKIKEVEYLIFPIKQDEKIVATIGRANAGKEIIDKYKKDNGKTILRYINSKSDFSKILFGYDEIHSNTETVILVEGIFDKFNVDKLLNLHNKKKTRCLCTFGAKISNEQIYRMLEKNIKNIILLFDNDVIEKIKSSSIKLSNSFNVLVGFNKYGDPGDMNLSQLEKVLDNLESPSVFSISKISKKNLVA